MSFKAAVMVGALVLGTSMTVLGLTQSSSATLSEGFETEAPFGLEEMALRLSNVAQSWNVYPLDQNNSLNSIQ